MAESFQIITGDKNEIYQSLLLQVKALVGTEKDQIANLANISAAIKECFGFLWVGFYLVKNDSLVLGPFQGPIACTRIELGKGVCGSSWKDKKTYIVDDVSLFPGHIACSSKSKSEIVVPIIKEDLVVGVLDIDSEEIATFDKTDAFYLEKLVEWVSSFM